MDLVIETNRLILRAMRHNDAEALFEMDKNPKVHQYLWNKPLTDIKQVHKYIEMVNEQYIVNKIGRFVAIEKENNQLIGWTGIKFNTDMVNNKINFYDIGYRLNEKFWGKGYATEASLAWLDYGFNTMEIPKMDAGTQQENLASNKILEKIGMVKTGNYEEDGVVWNWYEKNGYGL